MCGIAGAVYSSEIERNWENVAKRLSHRGPDAFGIKQFKQNGQHAALVHARLSIIDLQGGTQPMTNEDGDIWVSFNGEIYNFETLKKELESSGHAFCTRSDTEVLVHGYEAWAQDLPARLQGMFAFGVWSQKDESFFLARDRLGQKPLYYAHGEWGFAFASELAALLDLLPEKPQVSTRSILNYLVYQYVPDPDTIFQGIAKLMPGQWLTYRHHKIKTNTYWHPTDIQAQAPASPGDLDEQLRACFLDAVSQRLVSDVPLGAFLSGGIDSSLVAAAMTRLATSRVRTFAIGFEDAAYDETAYAQAMAKHLGTQHHTFQVKPDAMAILPEIIERFGEPFADASAIPTYYLARQTRSQVKVALSGDGGDEMFWGYRRYRAVRAGGIFDRFSGPFRKLAHLPLWSKLEKQPHRGILRTIGRLAGHLDKPPLLRYLEWIRIFSPEMVQQVVNPQLMDQQAWQAGDYLASKLDELADQDVSRQVARLDILTYLPNDILVKVDRMSMAHGLEVRSPFLDHRMVALAVGLPPSCHMSGFTGKKLLKRAFKGWIPNWVFRRKKMGFGVPLAGWFRGPLAGYLQNVLLDKKSLERGYFAPEAVQKLLDDHIKGHHDHANRLWALLVLELWHRRFVDA